MTDNSEATILLNTRDNVAVARRSIQPGGATGRGDLMTAELIGRGHKVALTSIKTGEEVLKYGQVIGMATQDIEPGRLVHLHNLAMVPSEHAHQFSVDIEEKGMLPLDQRRTFMGFDRGTGGVGTRNYIGVIASVNCSATVSRYIADYFNRDGGLDGFDNIDGVVALTHSTGCAINTKSEGYRLLIRTIQGYARHPNFGGILLIGLGCETNQIAPILEHYKMEEGERLRTMTIQQHGGTRKTIEAAIAQIKDMLPGVNAARRTEQPLSALKVALECGGSDGYSGISANPALGYASDLIVQNGGTTVLAETPEIYGAEHLLTRRAVTPAVAEKLLQRIDWWRDYTARNGDELNNNPSHGNKLGGLTTILEKSLGAVAKGGSMPLKAVYEFAETVTEPGFVFMDTPGYDPVAVTGQVAGGCNVICFTTGRGSVSGFKPSPCIKIATNSEMYEHMKEDMDINCGEIVTGQETIQESGKRIFEHIIAVASGDKTVSEIYDYGDNEFVPWQVGSVT
ncbi:UxaA family hydrolase [Agrobacterium rosae]|uniref:Altronate dehydratase family protein n=1 Tax=Agrobacterium rosae TaxID=1972867 RepID=A0AAE5VMV3_9HYPH|nr:altronate dehydratase family protein [Agrobacterium rosae]KAA3510571.1 altronate dehydratase [Agrobacterium rosae]KAA3517289.1 altronate dehydratase [Agrobacterium rosae]MCM2434753.1 altronate dehydratase [Agrobacterium rosae]MDX8330295.1 altronate dehydratase family protein [Agrobacterium rosae]MQB50034.1 altronate dehydratase [Agrobacterium rosae]